MSANTPVGAGAVLLVHNTVYPSPPDIIESVRALKRHSRFPVLTVNAAFGYPNGLDRVPFDVIVLHYTMFYERFEPLGPEFRQLLTANEDAIKVAFFQDEQAYFPERLSFCSDYGIGVIFTCLEAPASGRAYAGTGAHRIVTYLPGYVSESLRVRARKLARSDEHRPIDIGYRGRRPPASWSGAALEKYEIAESFERHADDLDLVLDIETDEAKRVYGRAWPRFIASCKAMLGTESGSEISLPEQGGELSIRTISPRHLEAAALRTCQILYEGRYAGILKPLVHYIPLNKDFSNFDAVIAAFRDSGLRRELTRNAHRDLISTDGFSYQAFARSFDDELRACGVQPSGDPLLADRLAAAVYPPKLVRRTRRQWRRLRVGARLARSRVRSARG